MATLSTNVNFWVLIHTIYIRLYMFGYVPIF